MALVFDVSGEMAMFRRGYTTTSAVSFPFPPPTTIAGLVSAIVGYDNGSRYAAYRADYWERMGGTRVALRVLRPGRIRSHAVKFQNTKFSSNENLQRSIINHQFLFDASYRVYVEGPVEEDLEPMLAEGRCVYPPCLGVAYAPAIVDYVGRMDFVATTDRPERIHSVLPWNEGMCINIKESGRLFREDVPFSFDTERNLTGMSSVVYSADSPVLLEEGGDVARCDDETISWFPRWIDCVAPIV